MSHLWLTGNNSDWLVPPRGRVKRIAFTRLNCDLVVIYLHLTFSYSSIKCCFISRILLLLFISESLPERTKNINDYFMFRLYSNVCRSLFEKHKLLFAVLLAVRVLQHQGKINEVSVHILKCFCIRRSSSDDSHQTLWILWKKKKNYNG